MSKGTVRTELKLTQERLKEVLDYNSDTGVFVWKLRLSKNVPIGRKAGRNMNGYRYIRIDDEDYQAARLAWFYVNGVWPSWRLEFKNGSKDDCRIENLAERIALAIQAGSKSAYEKEWRKQFPNKVKDGHLRNTFGMTLAEYTAKHTAQNGLCAICAQKEWTERNGKVKALAVDHNHETGQIRDLLCAACNKALGQFKEDIAVLESAIRYLKKHQTCDSVDLVSALRAVGA